MNVYHVVPEDKNLIYPEVLPCLSAVAIADVLINV